MSDETTPDVVGAIMAAMLDDDTNDSARIILAYESADDTGKTIINDILISLCGHSLPTLIEQAEPLGD